MAVSGRCAQLSICLSFLFFWWCPTVLVTTNFKKIITCACFLNFWIWRLSLWLQYGLALAFLIYSFRIRLSTFVYIFCNNRAKNIMLTFTWNSCADDFRISSSQFVYSITFNLFLQIPAWNYSKVLEPETESWYLFNIIVSY